MAMDYEAFRRLRKPTAKGIQVWDGKRPQNCERSEIEQGYTEWEEERDEKDERD